MSQSQPPGPTGLPIAGNTLQHLMNPLEFKERCAEEYGDLVRVRIGGDTRYEVNDPDLVETVLVSEHEKYVKPEELKEVFWSHDDPDLTKEEALERRRRLLRPAFLPQRLRHLADTITGHTELHANHWNVGETYSMKEEMKALNLAIITKSMLGTDLREEDPELVETIVGNLGCCYAEPSRLDKLKTVMPGWMATRTKDGFEDSIEMFREFIGELVQKRKAEDSEDWNDLLSVLLQTRDTRNFEVTDERIRDEVLGVIGAGYETTSQGLMFMWYLLSEYPRVREKLQDELDEVLGGRPPTLADLDDLEYLEKTIKEALRVYPASIEIPRETAEDTHLGGYHVPEGSTVRLNIWTIQRSDEYYEDPDTFRPERWDGSLKSEIPQFAYFPFGGGPHRCVGKPFAQLEAKLVVGTIAQHYELDTAADSPPNFQLESSNLHPEDGLQMVVNER